MRRANQATFGESRLAGNWPLRVLRYPGVVVMMMAMSAVACRANVSSSGVGRMTTTANRATAVAAIGALSRPDIVHYEVEGDSPRALRTSMRLRGPHGWAGYTSWHVQWRYGYLRAPNRCRIGRVTIRRTGRITLPSWLQRGHAPDEVRQRWDKFVEALALHEEGHWWAALQASEQIRQYLQRLPGTPSCDALEGEADAVGSNILKSAAAFEWLYDLSTRHGQTQGARVIRE